MDKQRIACVIYGMLALMLTACSFGDEPSPCPYNVRMEYWYAGSSAENALPTYVDNIRQYLFDEEGNLLAGTTLRGDSITGWNADLKDGTYTLVVWGNLGEEGKEATTVTTKSDYNMNEMTLSAITSGVPRQHSPALLRHVYLHPERRDYGTPACLPVACTRRPQHHRTVAYRRKTSARRYLADAPERHPRPLRLYRRNRTDRPLGQWQLYDSPERKNNNLSRNTGRHELRLRSDRRIRHLSLYGRHPRAVEPLVRRRASHRRSRPPPLFLQATDEHGPEYGTGVRPPDHRI